MANKLFFLLAVGYTIALVAASLLSLKDTPINEITVSDKTMHGVAYFLLVIVWSIALSTKTRKTNKKNKQLVFVAGGAFAVGIIIEVLQGVLTGYREPDLLDILANTVGVLIAVAFITGKRKMFG